MSASVETTSIGKVFGARLKQYRKALHVKQEGLGQSIGCSKSTISEIENGKHTPHLDTAVAMRNHFEHFDERLERWWSESPQRIYIDWSITNTASVEGYEPIERFRILDPDTMALYFWSEEFNLQALLTEVQRILPTLRAAVPGPHWATEPESPAE